MRTREQVTILPGEGRKAWSLAADGHTIEWRPVLFVEVSRFLEFGYSSYTLAWYVTTGYGRFIERIDGEDDFVGITSADDRPSDDYIRIAEERVAGKQKEREEHCVRRDRAIRRRGARTRATILERAKKLAAKMIEKEKKDAAQHGHTTPEQVGA